MSLDGDVNMIWNKNILAKDKPIKHIGGSVKCGHAHMSFGVATGINAADACAISAIALHQGSRGLYVLTLKKKIFSEIFCDEIMKHIIKCKRINILAYMIKTLK